MNAKAAKTVFNSLSQVWNVAGITRDSRSLRIMDSTGNLVALVPVNLEDQDSVIRAEALAQMLTSTATLYKSLQAVIRWDEKQDKSNRLPRSIERQVIASLAKADGNV